MTWHSRLAIASLAALVSFGFGGAPSGAQQSPNVIVIIADDVGYADFGFSAKSPGQGFLDPGGNAISLTPNLDDLAARGVSFSRAYVGASCQPSRAALVTGGYQQRIGNEVVGNVHTSANQVFEGVPVETETIWDRMKSRNYTTGAFGKWHLGQTEDTPTQLGNRPQNQGIDEFRGTWSNPGPYTVNQNESNPGRILREAVVQPNGTIVTNNIGANHHGEYITQTFGQFGVDFIRDHANQTNPFFLYQSFSAAHVPWDDASPDINDPRIAHLTPSSARRRVGSSLITMDKEIGRMLARLEDPNGDGNDSDSVADNTLIVFVNDNGGAGNTQNGQRGADNGDLRGIKQQAFEGGIRVPMLIAGAGISAAAQGSIYDAPVHGVDILPTVFEAAGGKFGPNESKIDGVNLLPYINAGNTADPGDDPHEVLVHRWRRTFAVVKGDFKLINWNPNLVGNPANYALYDLKNDLGETTNLINQAQYAGLVAELKRDLTHHEAFFDKQRYANFGSSVDDDPFSSLPEQPLNIFDHFAFRPNGNTQLNWSDNDAWLEGSTSNPSGTGPTKNLYSSDSFPGAIIEFGTTNNQSYVATNDLLRHTGGDFMLNKLLLSGNFNSSQAQQATIQGNPLLFTSDLKGAGPQIAITADNTSTGNYRYDIDLDVILYDNLEITGDGDVTVTINGTISDYFDPRNLTKSGNSSVTLTGNNTYAGDTIIIDGELSITNAFLANTADVHLTMDSIFDLDFTGTDTIDSLFIDGIAQATGTWGSLTSAATNKSNLFTGSGMILVSTLGPAGDFDSNGRVDGTDFLQWQRGDSPLQGSSSDLNGWQVDYGSIAPPPPQPPFIAQWNMDLDDQTPYPASESNSNLVSVPAITNQGEVGGISSGGDDLFARATLVADNLADAIANNDYITFTIDPQAGFELDLTDISWDWTANTSIENGEWFALSLLSSIDGFTEANVIATSTNSRDGAGTLTLGPETFDLSASEFQNLTSAIEFRLYFTSNANLAGDLMRLDNLTVNGSLTAGFAQAVPEPSSELLVSLTILLGMQRRSKRRSELTRTKP